MTGDSKVFIHFVLLIKIFAKFANCKPQWNMSATLHFDKLILHVLYIPRLAQSIVESQNRETLTTLTSQLTHPPTNFQTLKSLSTNYTAHLFSMSSSTTPSVLRSNYLPLQQPYLRSRYVWAQCIVITGSSNVFVGFLFHPVNCEHKSLMGSFCGPPWCEQLNFCNINPPSPPLECQ